MRQKRKPRGFRLTSELDSAIIAHSDALSINYTEALEDMACMAITIGSLSLMRANKGDGREYIIMESSGAIMLMERGKGGKYTQAELYPKPNFYARFVLWKGVLWSHDALNGKIPSDAVYLNTTEE